MNKVLIANRSEIAVRVLRACKELGLATVAVYSEADAEALHVRAADEAVLLGKPKAAESYLNIDRIIAAAQETGADAIHPGYGFLAENAEFAAACERAGITFIGPPSNVIATMGYKTSARQLAREADVPIVPGSDVSAEGDDALAVAEEVGFPVLVKAAAGGGGRGIRTVREPGELPGALAAASREAEAAFGDPSLYIEKLIEDARHIEVQVLGDADGRAIHLFERECSLQRRRQKLLEEAPAPRLSQSTREAMATAAVRFADWAGYKSAGTAEFLVGPDERFYLIEMNTRMQVEHGVTELITGTDLVRQQLLVAAGEPIEFRQDDVRIQGSAIEFRINAEDPDKGFLPSPGKVETLELPGGPGVRVDTALYTGYSIAPFYDSLVAKLMVWGPTRDQALARGRRALDELTIEGIATTTPLHLRLVDDERVRAGRVDIHYLENLLAEG
jgi:acetyl-CoA carboxylase biotin carboxylase subunit